MSLEYTFKKQNVVQAKNVFMSFLSAPECVTNNDDNLSKAFRIWDFHVQELGDASHYDSLFRSIIHSRHVTASETQWVWENHLQGKVAPIQNYLCYLSSFIKQHYYNESDIECQSNEQDKEILLDWLMEKTWLTGKPDYNREQWDSIMSGQDIDYLQALFQNKTQYISDLDAVHIISGALNHTNVEILSDYQDLIKLTGWVLDQKLYHAEVYYAVLQTFVQENSQDKTLYDCVFKSLYDKFPQAFETLALFEQLISEDETYVTLVNKTFQNLDDDNENFMQEYYEPYRTELMARYLSHVLPEKQEIRHKNKI